MIYLDNSATTRVCPEAVAAMTEAMTADFFNPSALYAPSAGIKARADAVRSALYNGLENAAAALLPEIRALSSIMAAYGAKDPLMTGSGAAVFSLFESREKAEVVASLLRQDGFFAAVAPLL